MDFETYLTESAEASKEARKLGLSPVGYGMWQDKKGNIVKRIFRGKLVDVNPNDKKDYHDIESIKALKGSWNFKDGSKEKLKAFALHDAHQFHSGMTPDHSKKSALENAKKHGDPELIKQVNHILKNPKR